MRTCFNAFCIDTNQPRFPDGRASESTGLRFMSNQELEYTVNGTMEICLFPGLNTCLTIRNANSKLLGQTGSVENAYATKLQGVNQNVIGQIVQDGSTLRFTQNSNTNVAKWRGVSYGMFFQTVNNADENDGWWEAIRIQPSQNISEYGFTYDSTATADQPLHLWHDIPDVGGDCVNQISYSSGVIRNLGQYLFQLNHEVGERDFVDMNDDFRLELGTTPLSNQGGIPLDANKVSPDNIGVARYLGGRLPELPGVSTRLKDEAISQFLDSGFDCIYLRIHGADSSTGRAPTRLTCTCAMNMELVYDEKALNSRFHMPAVYHPLHEKIRGSVKAAEPNFLLVPAEMNGQYPGMRKSGYPQ